MNLISKNKTHKKLIFLFFVTSFLFSCKTEYRKIEEKWMNGTTKIEYVYPDKSDKTCYTIFEYFPNSKLKFKGKVQNEKFVETKEIFYENGNRKEVDSITTPCELTFCCCDGKVYKYYPNGKLDQSFENKNGEGNGLLTFYTHDSTGIIDKTYTLKNSKKNGSAISYFKSGKVYSRSTYLNDTLIDFIYYFKENGDTSKYFYHFKGKEDFPAKKWLENGQILNVSYLDKTYKKALYIWTDKNGVEIKREIISADEKGNFEL
jgi:antitoxin component YwqK of YwqJK toxin-antitoxin module